jgi:peptidoglycan/LPS O-acetylase OafA/YrhL
MIEIGRYVLAATVAQTHLWPSGALGVVWTGQIAVFAFYTLSGYLITRVLNERYGFTPKGTAAFILNRVLRLWPAYLTIMVVAIAALQFLNLSNFFPLIRMPQNFVEIVTNITILGQVTFDFAQWLPLAKPLPTSWSLSIEIVCYILLALYFAKSPQRLWTFAAFGAIAMAISTAWCATCANATPYGPYCFQNRYGVVQAGFVPFAFGGIYYFHRKAITSWLKRYHALSLSVLAATLPAMFGGVLLPSTVGPFLGIPLIWLLLAANQDVRPTRAQDFLGRASYHLFIAHMPIAAILVIGLRVAADSIVIYFETVLVSFVFSAFFIPVESYIDRTRQRIVAMSHS